MPAISAVKSSVRHGFVRKPALVGREGTTKLIRLNEDQLKLIERAARSHNTSSSWYISQAAIAKARADLRLPPATP